jgi:hypothetical protein
MPLFHVTLKFANLTGDNLDEGFVNAESASQAVAHFTKDRCEGHAKMMLTYQQLEVVDLTKNTKPQKPPAPQARTAILKSRKTPGAAAKEAAGQDVSHQEAMRILGVSSQALSDLKYQRKLAKGSTYGIVTRESLDAYMAAGGTTRKSRPAARKSNQAAQAPVKSVPATRTAKANPDGMIREEVLADNMAIAVEVVQAVKRRGGVAGGYGWVELEPWMEQYQREQE